MSPITKCSPSIKALGCAILVPLLALSALPADTSPAGVKWDGTLYVLGAGMTGDVMVLGLNADVNTNFGTVVDHLKLGFMGKLRASRGPWAVTTDLIFMKLGASKGPVGADLDQWAIEPTISYRLDESFEWLAGVRYNSIRATIKLPLSLSLSAKEDWYDPIVGFNYNLAIDRAWSFNLRADVGGFGIGSKLAWQVFPDFGWRFSDAGTLQMGYRWVHNHYETGSGLTHFRYNMLTSGPQAGVNFRF
jgi:hypothetical protein